MHLPFRLTPLVKAALTHCCLRTPLQTTALAGALLLPVAAQAQDTTFDIPAQSLTGALRAFAEQADVQLIYNATDVKDRRSAPVQGAMKPLDALAALLVGTGFSYKLDGDTVVLIPSKESATLLQAVRVTANAENPAVTEGSGSYTTRAMGSATKLPLSPRETPQSISVLTRAQMDDQGIESLDEAFRGVTGLVAQKGYYVGDGGQFSARGFALTSIMLDGLPTSLEGNYSFNANSDDMAIYDRVEVVRGANGLTQGVGSPSAGVNLIRKRPTADPLTSLTLTGGSWNKQRVDFDASRSLNDSGSLRGRVVAAYENSDTFIDLINVESKLLYAVFAADLGANTTLTVGANIRDKAQQGLDASLPNALDGSYYPLPRSTYLGTDYDYWKNTKRSAFAELKHGFANGWQTVFTANAMSTDVDMMYSSVARNDWNTPEPYSPFNLYTQAYTQQQEHLAADLYASGPFTLFERKHELVVGGSWAYHDLHGSGGWDPDAWTDRGPPVDIYNWDPYSVDRPGTGSRGAIDYSLWGFDIHSKQPGLYTVARLNLADPLKLIIGSRFSRYRNEGWGGDYKMSTEITPYAGLVFDVDKSHTVYASYTEIFQPQGVIDQNDDPLPPITGTNYEAGLKGEYFDKRLNWSLAYFNTRQTNRPTDDVDSPNPCKPNQSGYCQRASGEVESQGVELEVSGSPLPGLELVAGYSYLDVKFVTDTDPLNEGANFDPKQPRNLYKVSANYKLPGALKDWNVGGSLYSQSEIRDAYYGIRQGAYTVLDLLAGYQINPRLSANLNVYNVLDETYFQGIGYGDSGNMYGEPRSFMVRLRYRI